MRKTIALIGGGFKPFTKGHYMLVSQAANESDEVFLFVSTTDRVRAGQLPVFWDLQMSEIWDKYLQKAMPNNVHVHYVKNPTTAMWDTLKDAEEEDSNHNTYVIYGGEDDIPKYFATKYLEKHVPRLLANDQIETKTPERIASGTNLRKNVVDGDVVAFAKGLPGPVQRYAQEIFDILARTIDQISDKPKKKRK